MLLHLLPWKGKDFNLLMKSDEVDIGSLLINGSCSWITSWKYCASRTILRGFMSFSKNQMT
jgi:hypothetical protein